MWASEMWVVCIFVCASEQRVVMVGCVRIHVRHVYDARGVKCASRDTVNVTFQELARARAQSRHHMIHQTHTHTH